MAYLESLPAGCPPLEAEEITEQRTVLRLVASDPPTMEDFKSQRALHPNKPPLKDASKECRFRGLSVTLTTKDCDTLLKLPTLVGKLICSVNLTAGAGSIQNTSSVMAPTHHTWWPLAGFDILSHSSVIKP
jgi:hypothetical protein